MFLHSRAEPLAHQPMNRHRPADAPGGREAVKLEQQILVTAEGHELLSDLAFEDRLL